MFYLQQSDESQFLQVLNDLGRVDDVVHLLIENAWNETDITHRGAEEGAVGGEWRDFRRKKGDGVLSACGRAEHV